MHYVQNAEDSVVILLVDEVEFVVGQIQFVFSWIKRKIFEIPESSLLDRVNFVVGKVAVSETYQYTREICTSLRTCLHNLLWRENVQDRNAVVIFGSSECVSLNFTKIVITKIAV